MWQILRRYCQLVLVFFACHIAFKWRFCGICELCHNWKTRKYAHYIILTLSFFSPNKENSRFLIFCLLCWAAASAAVSISSPSPGSGSHSAVLEYQYTSAIFMRLCNSGVLCSHYTLMCHFIKAWQNFRKARYLWYAEKLFWFMAKVLQFSI